MTRRAGLVRIIALVGISWGLMVTAVAPASAERLSRADPRGDMDRYTDSPFSHTDAPDRRLGDVTRTLVRHSTRQIVLRLNYARLHHRQDVPFNVFWTVDTKELPLTRVNLEAGPGQLKGELTVEQAPSRALQARVDCSRHKISYRKNFIRVVLLRSCLPKPRPWIRVANRTTFYGVDPNVRFVDDGLSDAVFDLPQRSRKIWVGARP